jgi:hypothetical protein
MPEIITVPEGNDIILIRSFGDISHQDLENTLKEVIKVSNEKRIKKILIDAREVNSYPASGFIFEFGSKMAGILYSFDIAIIPSPKFMKETRFFKTVGNNRGTGMRLYESLEEAIEGLENIRKTEYTNQND